MFEVIIFDLDRTLVDTNRAREETYVKIAQKLIKEGILPKVKEKEIVRNLAKYDGIFPYKGRFYGFSKKYFSDVKRKALWIDRLYWHLSLEKFKLYKLFFDVRGVLGKLKKRYRLYLVSYGIPWVQNKKIKNTGIKKYFLKTFITQIDRKELVINRIFGIERKKNPKLKKSEILMIGDSPSSDILAAKRTDVASALVDYYKSYRGKNYSGIRADFKINKMSDLLKILD